MIKINDNFTRLSESYLFSDIARRVKAYSEAHPEAEIIRMGIGDVTRPICRAAVEAMHRAVDDESSAATFRGYGPEQGYDFLREAIVRCDYAARGLDIGVDEVFVSDGAKSDTGNIGDILGRSNLVAVTDPVYPVYVDTNIMAGRRIVYLPSTPANGFCPALPDVVPDMIYLCYPNNPTGASLTRKQLKVWVDYALRHRSLILFDSAYEAYISPDSADVPHSIYEVEGARKCAVEFRSFSKTAGFTGLRCGYTVVPRDLCGVDESGREVSLNRLWLRRQTTKFNGASYITQRAAEAVYTPEGRSQIHETIRYYMDNAALLRRGLADCGLKAYGGIDAPYVWVATPEGMGSWDFFDELLRRGIVGTPGCGFGRSGEGYLRLTAFNTRENTLRAIELMQRR